MSHVDTLYICTFELFFRLFTVLLFKNFDENLLNLVGGILKKYPFYICKIFT